MIFVCGIHGVEKTEYCQELSVEKKIPFFSEVQLMERTLGTVSNGENNLLIKNNYKILIKEIEKIQAEISDFILEGHICSINQNGDIECMPIEVFRILNINCLQVLVKGANNIREYLSQKDEMLWNENLIEKLQNSEIRYAKKISNILGIDIKIITVNDKNKTSANHFGKNIILPIKPIYAEKILNGEKEYEYRKQLCIESIDKVYLYATSPVKAILGEVEVLEKMTVDKNRLWTITKNKSGISREYFEEYFHRMQMASAYRLGKSRRYESPVMLKAVGISFVPQSYIYVEDLSCKILCTPAKL